MHVLTIQIKLNPYKTITPYDKLSMIIYPKVLTLFWKRQALRSETPRNTIIKQFNQIKSNLKLNGQPVIMFNDSNVAESIFNFILVIYKSQIFDKLKE